MAAWASPQLVASSGAGVFRLCLPGTVQVCLAQILVQFLLLFSLAV